MLWDQFSIRYWKLFRISWYEDFVAPSGISVSQMYNESIEYYSSLAHLAILLPCYISFTGIMLTRVLDRVQGNTHSKHYMYVSYFHKFHTLFCFVLVRYRSIYQCTSCIFLWHGHSLKKMYMALSSGTYSLCSCLFSDPVHVLIYRSSQTYASPGDVEDR